jgi:membrane protein required for colicin V production
MEGLGFNITDWAILVILVASSLISLSRGFVKEFLSLFLWVFAFVVSINFEHLVTPQILKFITNLEVAKIISYIVVFVLAIYLGGIFIKLISKLIKWSGASGFDKFLGVVFGFIRGAILVLVLFLIIPSGIKSSELVTNSKISPIINEYIPKVEAYLKNLLDNKNIIEQSIKIIEPVVDSVEDNLTEEPATESSDGEDT